MKIYQTVKFLKIIDTSHADKIAAILIKDYERYVIVQDKLLFPIHNIIIHFSSAVYFVLK